MKVILSIKFKKSCKPIDFETALLTTPTTQPASAADPNRHQTETNGKAQV
jgi:hypothetical protein